MSRLSTHTFFIGGVNMEMYLLMFVTVLIAFALTNYVALVQEQSGSVAIFFTKQFTDYKWVITSVLVIGATAISLHNIAIPFFAIGLLIAVSTIYDLKYYLSPDFINATIALIGITYVLYNERHLSALGEGMIICIVLYFIWLGTFYLLKNSVGGGDFKLFMALSFPLGVDLTFVTFFFTCMAVLAITPIFILAKKKISEMSIPLVPFVLVGYIIAVQFGEQLITWYMGG